MSTESKHVAHAAGHGAPAPVAAAFAAVTLSLWAEAGLRIWFSMGGDAHMRLWAARAGDIAALWLAITLTIVLAWAALVFAWRDRPAVGTLRAWTILLVVSAILAPLIGEWGQAIGV